jgi:hypothetical protein
MAALSKETCYLVGNYRTNDFHVMRYFLTQIGLILYVQEGVRSLEGAVQQKHFVMYLNTPKLLYLVIS